MASSLWGQGWRLYILTHFFKLTRNQTMLHPRTLCGEIVSPLGVGTGRLASFGAGYTRREALRCLAMAAEHGVNLIDTADSYGSGDCERLLGGLLKELGCPFLISTKAGYVYCRLPAFFSPLNQIGKRTLHKIGRRQCFEPTVIVKNIEHSLKRLRRDRADFFFLHDPTPKAMQDDELLRALLAVQQAGKVRHIGISFSPANGLQIPSGYPFAPLVQTSVNPWTLRPAGLDGTEIVANHVWGGSQFGRQGETLVRLAKEENVTARQLLIAYAAQRPSVKVTLVGTGRAEHLRENLGAIGRSLSAETIRRLDAMGGDSRV